MDDLERGRAAEYERVTTLAMLKVMMADGVVRRAEVETIASTFREITGRELSVEDIEEQADTVEVGGLDLGAALAEVARYLPEEGKELAVRAAIEVALADGAMHEDERAVVADVAQALGMSESRLQEIREQVEGQR